MTKNRFPDKQGLYDPLNEHDSCGIGFVAHIKGAKSNEIIRRGLEVLKNMNHRGATNADNTSGDGAGILIQVPHDFIVNVGINVPNPGKYGTGLLFLPIAPEEASLCLAVLERHIKDEGLELI